MTAIENLSLTELRLEWSKYWDMPAHKGLGRAMLEASLQFKHWKRDKGGIPNSVQKQLDELLAEYRSNRSGFNPNQSLKPGTRLERIYKGQKYSVLVTANGFEYDGTKWSSLSKIAGHITGSKWNGWVFFGLK